MSDKKRVQTVTETDSAQPKEGNAPDKAPDKQKLQIGADQGFVYYEE